MKEGANIKPRLQTAGLWWGGVGAKGEEKFDSIDKKLRLTFKEVVTLEFCKVVHPESVKIVEVLFRSKPPLLLN